MVEMRWAVIKESLRPYRFSTLHDSEESAVKEASLFAAQCQERFLILKVVGFAHPEKTPVKIEMWG